MFNSQVYKDRLVKVKSFLTEDEGFIISNNPYSLRTNDLHYEYKQNTDLTYLFGDLPQLATVLIKKSSLEGYIFLPEKNKQKIVWDGNETLNNSLLSRLKLKVITYKENGIKAISPYLNGLNKLYFSNYKNTVSFDLLQHLIASIPSHLRNLPRTYENVANLVGKARIIKSSEEILLIKEACKITNQSLAETFKSVKSGISEERLKDILEYNFKIRGAKIGFNSIVASGKSAATLHYSKCNQTLKSGELLMIDCGSEFKNYSSDITRVIPVSGKVLPYQKIIYDTVYEAQTRVIRKIKDGIKIKDLHLAATEVLIEGLKKLKVLKGSTKDIIKKKLYSPYFPHGIGHSLGLDVHDTGEIKNGNDPILKTGMIFTVEPGLYFSNKVGLVKSACGVRIEDDVLVKKSTSEILSR